MPSPVTVQLMNALNVKIGQVTLTEQEDGVHFQVEASGLEPGEHGFHVHEKALCEGPDFMSAGSHFNPRKNEHGFLNKKGPHAGDLPNIIADEHGAVKSDFVTNRLTLTAGKKHSLLRDGGTSLIIHSGKDDYITNPAGDSGNRVACGVIRELPDAP